MEFHWFPLWLAHILRGICIFIAPLTIILSIRLSRVRGMGRGQKLRFLGLSLLLSGAVYTEIARWNSAVIPLLFINVSGVIVAFFGLWSMRKEAH